MWLLSRDFPKNLEPPAAAGPTCAKPLPALAAVFLRRGWNLLARPANPGCRAGRCARRTRPDGPLPHERRLHPRHDLGPDRVLRHGLLLRDRRPGAAPHRLLRLETDTHLGVGRRSHRRGRVVTGADRDPGPRPPLAAPYPAG